MKKTLAAVVLAGSLTFAGAAAASAAPDTYTAPGVGQGQVSNGTVTVGQQFIFSGTGFAPFETIKITVTLAPKLQGFGGGGAGVASGVFTVVPGSTQTFSAKADANGKFSIALTLDTPGTYVLTATGLTSGHTVTATVTVTGAAAAAATSVTPTQATSGLANTGVDGSVLAWSLVGFGAVAAGASTVVVARRRNRATA
ncbi:peptidase [Paenarthrobacter sp. DKR-5]|uniref:peptidase n=1 Tax=Paenarthrobacter sp. DKR-5 TaxID=2835535 RepID=UPI001BDCE0D8|nr:peptidase [Paenarthrobacter sp. DKR-5]MBT1004468.1 peptidase [Paenarthrobacter sp. DKR-5]